MAPLRHSSGTWHPLPGAHVASPPDPGMGVSAADVGLLAAYAGCREVFVVPAALVISAGFPHSVSDPGQCARERGSRGERPRPEHRER